MRTLELSKIGKGGEKEISRKTLIQEFDINPRDLRPIFSVKQVATIARRGECIIVNLRSIRMIIGARKVYIFGTEDLQIKESFLPLLIEKIKGPKTVLFEHIVLESALGYVVEKVKSRFEYIEKIAEKLLASLKNELRDSDLEKLLSLKKQISKIDTSASELNEIIDDALDDEKEIMDLYLDKKKDEDTEELESILENYQEQIEDVMNRSDDLNENIDDTQEILDLQMANRRNVIIKFDLLLTTFTVIFSFAAVVVGLFGMNIKNRLEGNPEAFQVVTVGLILMTILSSLWIWRYLKKRQVF